jgi:hypothetical protein
MRQHGGRIWTLALMGLLFGLPLIGQTVEVSFFDGNPVLVSGNKRSELDFGQKIQPGESIITGRHDRVELRQGRDTINILPNTHFTIKEADNNGRKETVFSNTVGSVTYAFEVLTGRRQQVGTATAVAGVRGTVFTVFAGSDGSSLFFVESGLVEVASAGISVDLPAGTAVEVMAGQAPGPVVQWLGKQLDYSSWDSQQLDRFRKDPAAEVLRLSLKLDEFIKELSLRVQAYEDFTREINRWRDAILATAEDTAKDRLRQENLYPAMNNAGTAILNYRYYALSALSLRRYVLGRLYADMKAHYILDPLHPVFQEFLTAHNAFLNLFEQAVTPYLVLADL